MKNEEIVKAIQQILKNEESITAKSVQERIGETALIQVQKAIRTLLDNDEIYLVVGSSPKEYKGNDKGAIQENQSAGTRRNLQKFEFKGLKNLGKSQLALNIIKEYVCDFNPSYEELKTVFPDSLLKPYGVFQRFEDAVEQSKDRKRFFMSDADVITLKQGEKICVTNQWTSERLDGFISSTLKITQYEIKEMQ